MVLQEDQRCNNNNNNSSSGGRGGGGGGGGGGGNSRSCKKAKQDKIPQRGLGVAELERILQDQQRNSGSSAIALPSSSGLVLPPPLSLPRLPHPSSAAIATVSSSSFRTGTTATASNIFGQSSTTMSLSSLPLPVLPDSHALYSRSMGIVAGGHTTNFGLPYTLQNDPLPNPIWWCLPQSQRRTQQQQSTTKSSSSLLPSSSGANIQMEPPSNQIPFSSNYTLPPSPWAEDERAGNIKRPWPFPFENPIAPGPCKIPNSFTKPDHELPLPVYGADAFRTEQRNISCRESSAASGSGSYQVDYRTMPSNYHQPMSLVDMGNLKDSGFLPPDHLYPLIPPTPAPAPSSFKYKQPINIPPANYLENPEFNLPPSSFPISRCETDIPPGTSLQKPFYEFLPTEPICTGTSSNKEGEEEDSIDLRLKL